MMMDAARQVVRAHENGSTRCLGKKIGSYQSKEAGYRKGGLRLLVHSPFNDSPHGAFTLRTAFFCSRLIKDEKGIEEILS